MTGLETAVEAVLAAARRSWPLPGVAVCVVDRDGERLVVCDGCADVGAGTPVDARTRFEIGSISKSFTSFVLGQLADEGRVDLDASVIALLPWLTPASRFSPITLRHLMAHTSGLITGSDALPDALASAVALRDSEVGAEPGAFFHYSNIGYGLLGLAIEAVCGRPVGEVVAERLLAPLGMTESAAVITHEDRRTMATGYQALHDDRPLLPGDPLITAPWFEVSAADGNIVATASDLGRYARMLLGRGRLDGAEIVAAERFASLTDDRLAPAIAGYALGLEVEASGERLVHGGGMVGYSSFLAVDLRAGVGVVVLTNAPGESGAAGRVARGVLAVAAGEQPADVAVTFDTSWVPDAARLVGHYSGGGEVAIDVRDAGGGRVELVAGGVTGRLYDLGDGILGCDHPAWRAFPHRCEGEGAQRRWLYGRYALRVADAGVADAGVADAGAGSAEWDELVGHYRSWTPWYPSFRVVRRGDALLLIAPTGVEAPGGELELVALGGRRFRIGSDPRLPERLEFGAAVDGVAVEAVRDGCRYSRTFRP